MYGKYFFGTPILTLEEKKNQKFPFWHVFLIKRVRVNSFNELCRKAREEWRTNQKLRKQIRDYHEKYAPQVKFISVGVGLGKDANVSRNRISIDIWDE